MARGLVFGKVVRSGSGLPEANADVSISAVRGADVNGSLVPVTVPMKPRDGYVSALRPTDKAGVFVIPFRWDEMNADNWGRVTGVDTLKIRVNVIRADGNLIRSFEGDGYKIMDGLRLANDIKDGSVLRQGAGRAAMAPFAPGQLTPEFKKAVTGKEFDGIPFTLYTANQTAILGLLPMLVM